MAVLLKSRPSSCYHVDIPKNTTWLIDHSLLGHLTSKTSVSPLHFPTRRSQMSTVAVSFWSLSLTPGKPEEVEPESDIRVAHVSLGDELEDESKRTSVKITYASRRVFDEDEEGSDNEDESGLAPKTTVLCSLTPGKIEQTGVDIVLVEDEKYTLEAVGPNTIHLQGNYIFQPPPVDEEPDYDEMMSEDSHDLREVSSDVEMLMDELRDDGEDGEKHTGYRHPSPTAAKKMKSTDGTAVGPDKDEKVKSEKSKKEKKEKKKEKRQKQKASDKAAEAETPKKDEKATPTAVTLPNGLVYEDWKVGEGRKAKKGDKVSMRYIGKLKNGEVFDKNTSGSPFTFQLGRGQVIEGWEIGIVGMTVGGERRLTVPAKLGYGKRSMDGIPANSTLLFGTLL
ncbi:FKBP-like protein [Fistulina hepatica ATCC 64428]|uniref:peptidylprolyl isomerase n=1 Tax=Fistulina hepatica ATCC 64428 TaxID=1128425 RepID=A0A0D7AH25_9AGAR|nr:FKBP-like protein [Fistulina hepatica ATCC 64428]